jgi:uncharacterized protein (TIGR03067 family)
MDKTRWLVILSIAGLLASCRVTAQDVVGPGSTTQGDILRGQGQLLKGMAWYELSAARARELDLKTARELEQWNRDVYEAYQRELTASAARRRSVRNERVGEAKKGVAEREQRLRTRPTVEDIQSGDALNALLLDLSDPSISESAWRYAKVPLPESLAIPRLIFRFAPRRGDKTAQSLTSTLIALGRLEVRGRWPAYLAIDELSQERRAYEQAYARVKAQSLEGKLTLGAILELDKAVDALDARARTAVPSARNFRAAAVQTVDGIKKAAKMFDASTIGFAQEMIADTHNHLAQTVGELLAFMRKYRLMFAPADGTPGVAEEYGRLYRLLQQQKVTLGLPAPTDQPHGRVDTANAETKNLQEVWSLKSNEMNGRILPRIPSENWTLTHDRDTIVVKRDGRLHYSGNCKVDPMKSPKEIDYVISEGRGQGTVMMGIYELNGDTLRVCVEKTRPEKFESLVGAGHQLLYYIRVRP